jgi:prefoldin subunit 5
MTFEMTRIKQRLADLEKNQEKLLNLIFEANSTMAALQIQINMITEKNTGKDHP